MILGASNEPITSLMSTHWRIPPLFSVAIAIPFAIGNFNVGDNSYLFNDINKHEAPLTKQNPRPIAEPTPAPTPTPEPTPEVVETVVPAPISERVS